MLLSIFKVLVFPGLLFLSVYSLILEFVDHSLYGEPKFSEVPIAQKKELAEKNLRKPKNGISDRNKYTHPPQSINFAVGI